VSLTDDLGEFLWPQTIGKRARGTLLETGSFKKVRHALSSAARSTGATAR